MFADSKYSKFLTAMLIIIIIAIIGLLGFLGYNMYQKYFVESDAKQFMEEYQQDVEQSNTSTNSVSNIEDPYDQINSVSTGGSSEGSSHQYKGFDVVGTIEIPKTKVEYPILAQVSKKAIEVAVAVQIGPGPNQAGNTVIVGHNYRNGQFFSNNKKLEIGDIIYITDNSGTKVKYTIYNRYETTPEDTDYMQRDTGGKREISLSTCTDNSKARLILWAKED